MCYNDIILSRNKGANTTGALGTLPWRAWLGARLTAPHISILPDPTILINMVSNATGKILEPMWILDGIDGGVSKNRRSGNVAKYWNGEECSAHESGNKSRRSTFWGKKSRNKKLKTRKRENLLFLWSFSSPPHEDRLILRDSSSA